MRYTNKKHLLWLAEKPCILQSYTKGFCSNDIQVHHLLKPLYSKRGMGLRAGDKDCVPLCVRCHRKLHLKGNEFKFFQEITELEDYVQLKAEYFWVTSPYNNEEF